MKKLLPIGIASILLTLGVITFFHIPKVEATFNGYTYQRTLTVANASSTQSSFTALVCFNFSQGNGNNCTTATDLKASSSGGSILSLNASNQANDLIFSTSTDGSTILPFEIERYASTTGELEAWVKMPTVANGQILYMYYGKSGDTSHQNVSGSWDSNYKGVYHMPQTLTADNQIVTDSTANYNFLSTHATSNWAAGDQVSGQIDGSLTFTQSKQTYLIYDQATIWAINANRTVSMWVKPSQSNENEGYIGTSNVTSPADGNLAFGVLQHGTHFAVYNWSAGYTDGTATISAGTWYYITVTFNSSGDAYNLYVNGSATPDASGSGTEGSGSNLNSYIGVQFFNYGDAVMDEVNFSTNIRSATWIATQYNSETNNATFWTVSAASTGSVIVPVTVSNVTILPVGKIEIKPGGNLTITNKN